MICRFIISFIVGDSVEARSTIYYNYYFKYLMEPSDKSIETPPTEEEDMELIKY